MDESAQSHSEPKMEKEDSPNDKSQSRISWRDLLITKSFELLIVIVGISIAFQLNSLKQESERRALEKFYLEGMLADLEKDLLEYEDNLKELTGDHKIALACLVKMEKQESVFDSLGLVVWNILSMKTFEGHRNAYSTIMSGNGLSLIRDTEIRNLMLDHYRLYAAIERFEEKYLALVSKVHDYFSPYIDYNHSDRILDESVLESVQTKNLLTIGIVQLQGGIWRYEESMEKAKTLRNRIHIYLE